MIPPVEEPPVPPIVEVPDTGVVSDPVTGLIAGLDLEGTALLTNPDVTVTAGVTWVPGISGNAFQGDADGDLIRIDADSLPELISAGSVQAWVKPQGTNFYTGVVHKGEMVDFSDEAWSLQFHTDRMPYFYLNCKNESGAVTSLSLMAPAQISLDTWSHLAATWNYNQATGDTTVSLYVNGVESVTVVRNGIGPAMVSDGDVIIGSQLPAQYDAGYGHLTFIGLVDEVSFYNRALGAAEIEAEYLVFAP